MAYENVREIQNDIDNLCSEAEKLIDSLGDDPDSDTNDWTKMQRVWEKIGFLEYRIEVVSDFIVLIYDIENEKEKFKVQKTAQYHYKDFEKTLGRILEICRLWKFRDYRCIDWIKRLSETIVDIKKYYEGRIF